MNLREELEFRGFLYQFTDEKVFDIFDKGGKTLYFGMDPSADSLHLGNWINFLASIVYLKRNNKLVLIVGGATGMIGDPGGKNAERNFLDAETLDHNTKSITEQVKYLAGRVEQQTGKKCDIEIINNYDFYKSLNFLDFLKEVGKYITVNQMMNKETVKKRITDPEGSISYTEFSYMLMQAYDYLKLFKEKGVTLQIAGSDQRGNVVMGIELIRKVTDQETFGVTAPLLLDSTGKKFGKSEGNALFLNKNKTTPYTIYQYFMNVADSDIERFCKMLTFMNAQEIADIIAHHHQAPEKRFGQEALAHNIVAFLHGSEDASRCRKFSEILFSDQPENLLGGLTKDDIDALIQEIGGKNLTNHDARITDELVELGLAPSKGEAKKLIESGAITINGITITDLQETFSPHFEKAKTLLVKKGKKNYRIVISS